MFECAERLCLHSALQSPSLGRTRQVNVSPPTKRSCVPRPHPCLPASPPAGGFPLILELDKKKYTYKRVDPPPPPVPLQHTHTLYSVHCTRPLHLHGIHVIIAVSPLCSPNEGHILIKPGEWMGLLSPLSKPISSIFPSAMRFSLTSCNHGWFTPSPDCFHCVPIVHICVRRSRKEQRERTQLH